MVLENVDAVLELPPVMLYCRSHRSLDQLSLQEVTRVRALEGEFARTIQVH